MSAAAKLVALADAVERRVRGRDVALPWTLRMRWGWQSWSLLQRCGAVVAALLAAAFALAVPVLAVVGAFALAAGGVA